MRYAPELCYQRKLELRCAALLRFAHNDVTMVALLSLPALEGVVSGPLRHLAWVDVRLSGIPEAESRDQCAAARQERPTPTATSRGTDSVTEDSMARLTSSWTSSRSPGAISRTNSS